MNRITDMSESDKPLSELYRIAADKWVEAEAAARELEELKTVRLEQMKNDYVLAHGGKVPDNRAEREVKASPEWEIYIKGMCEARTRANRWQREIKYIEMKEREIMDRNNTIRAEMRLSR